MCWLQKVYLNDSDPLEALPAQLLGNGFAGGTTLVQQQDRGSLVNLLEGRNLQGSDLQQEVHIS